MRHQVLQKRITDGQQHVTKYDLNLSSFHWSPANKAPLPLTKFMQRTAMIPVLLYFASSITKSEPQHYQKHSVPGICQHFNPLSNKEFSAGFTFNMHTTLYTTISIYAYQQQNVSKFHCCHAYVVYWYSPCVQ